VLRRIFGSKRDEVTGGWRKLHNKQLHNFYFSPNIIRMIKLRRISWAGHIAHMGEMRNAYKILIGNPQGKRPLGGSGNRWDLILKWILRNSVGWCGFGSSGSGQGPVAGSCEHGNEPSGSIKAWSFLTS
jgi:hypothetical protein